MRIPEFDFLRLVCNVLIVFVHCSALSLSIMYGVNQGVAENFLCNVVAWSAMPVFFVISGYFMALNFSYESWREKICGRVKRLVLPYVIWNAIYVVVLTVCSYIQGGSQPWPLWKGLLKIFGFATQPADTPLWYIRALFGWLLVLPLVSSFLFTNKRRVLTGAFAVLFLCGLTYLGLAGKVRIVFPLYSILAFGLGSVWAIDRINVQKHLRRWGAVYVVVGIFGYLPFFHRMFGEVMAFLRGLILLPIPFVLPKGIINRVSSSSMYRFLTAGSFFLYAFHRIVCWKIEPVIRRVADTSGLLYEQWGGLVLVSMDVFCVVSICYAVYGLMQSFAPKLCNLLSGR